MEQTDLDTAFTHDEDSIGAGQSQSQPSAATDDTTTTTTAAVVDPPAESGADPEAYFDQFYRATLTIGPAADFEPGAVAALNNETEPSAAASSPPTDLSPSSGAPPPLQPVPSVVVVDADSSDCVQCIDLTKENEEVLVVPRTTNRTRRTASRKTMQAPPPLPPSSNEVSEAADPDCPVVIEEVKPGSSTSRQSMRRLTRQGSRSTRNTMGAPVHDLTIVLDDETPSSQNPPSNNDLHSSIPQPSTSSTTMFPPFFAPPPPLPPMYHMATTTNILADESGPGIPTKRTRLDGFQDQMSINHIAQQLMSSIQRVDPLGAAYAMPTTSGTSFPIRPFPTTMTTTTANIGATSSGSSGGEKPKTELQCPVCLETLDELKEHNKLLMATLCGHFLCNACKDEHFKATSKIKTFSCPTCRGKLTKSKIHNLYI